MTINAITDEWHLTEPGVLSLTSTKHTIRWDGKGSFMVKWDGNGIGRCNTLAGAKEHTAWHIRELLAMGLEP